MHFLFKFILLTIFILPFNMLHSKPIGVEVKIPEGSLEFKLKKAVKDGVETAFYALPEKFSAAKGDFVFSALITEEDGKIEVSAILKGGDTQLSERIKGTQSQSFILGRNLAIRFAAKLLEKKGLNLSAKDRAKMSGAELSDKSSKAVIVFDAMGEGFKPAQLKLISQAVRDKAASIYGLDVKDSALMKNMMVEGGANEKECFDLSCQIEIAGAMGVEEGITIEITRADDLASISVKRVSNESNSILASQSARTQNTSLVSLIEKAENLVLKLYGQRANIKKANFGVGLSDLSDVKEVRFEQIEMPKIDFSSVDVKFLKVLESTMKIDKKKGASDSQKALAWKRVIDYPTSGSEEIKAQAKSRYNNYIKVIEAEKKRKDRIKKIRIKYGQDKQKLAEILTLDDMVVSKAQKQAYKDEFKKVYEPYMKFIDPPKKVLKKKKPLLKKKIIKKKAAVTKVPKPKTDDGFWNTGKVLSLVLTAAAAGVMVYGMTNQPEEPASFDESKTDEKYQAYKSDMENANLMVGAGAGGAGLGLVLFFVF